MTIHIMNTTPELQSRLWEHIGKALAAESEDFLQEVTYHNNNSQTNTYWSYMCWSVFSPLWITSYSPQSNTARETRLLLPFKDETRLRNFPRSHRALASDSAGIRTQTLTPESKHLASTPTAFSKMRPGAVKNQGLGSSAGREACVLCTSRCKSAQGPNTGTANGHVVFVKRSHAEA